jgi:hypothetical protein
MSTDYIRKEKNDMLKCKLGCDIFEEKENNLIYRILKCTVGIDLEIYRGPDGCEFIRKGYYFHVSYRDGNVFYYFIGKNIAKAWLLSNKSKKKLITFKHLNDLPINDKINEVYMIVEAIQSFLDKNEN